ncbi:MAG TPA: hypothetical protein VFK30_02150, partial [Anaerolineae bacterium]|nr:hypothetical protein [Anaerolineae bacterium]
MSHRPLADVLLDHTNFYIRFGLGREFNPANAVWCEYLHGLDQAADPVERTYQFYLQQQAATKPSLNEPTFGCFSYSLLSPQRIRLHFHNNDPIEYSPLSAERRSIRLAELAAMVRHIKTRVSDPTTIAGSSWLYNLGAYRQLFPVEYLTAARVVKGECAFLTLWGQFMNRFGQIKENLADQFLTHL